MQTGTMTQQIIIGGVGFTGYTTRQAEGTLNQDVILPAGVAGAVSAAGVDGLATGHGFVQGNVLDVHWTAAGVRKCRRGVTVDTATANAITFDNDPAASGDALPAEDTPVVVSRRTVIVAAWAGDETVMAAIYASAPCAVEFMDADASVLAVKLDAQGTYAYADGQDVANPFAGADLSSIIVSNGSADVNAIRVGVLYDSVTD